MSRSVSGRARARSLAAAIAAIGVLGACSSGSTSPTSAAPIASSTNPAGGAAPTEVAGTADPLSLAGLTAAVAQEANASPYSATMKIDTEVADHSQARMSAQVNLNGPLTGYVTLRYRDDKGKLQILTEVLTRQAGYTRPVNSSGKPLGDWYQTSRDAGDGLANYGRYAQLLLSRGAGAIKGTEIRDGVRTARLSGSVTAGQVREIEPSLFTKLQANHVRAFDCELWLTAQGRVTRLEQRYQLNGQAVHSTVVLTKFGAPLKVSAPTD